MTRNQKNNTQRSLYVDCQILQTAAFDRGMGKYTTSLLRALQKVNDSSKNYSKITLLLNKNLDASKSRLDEIKKLTACDTVVRLDLPTDISVEWDSKNQAARKTITEYLEGALDENVEIDFLMMAPFFVGFCSVFPDIARVRKFSIIYDITPQKIEHIQKIFPDDLYYQHYRIFFEADHLFTISNAVKDDLHAFVGVSMAKMTSIDGGPFTSLDSKAMAQVDTRNYKKPYVHLPSGPMVHKNNERAVKAFNQFNHKNNRKYTLYITSTFDDASKDKLSGLSDAVVFKGNVSDEEMHVAFKGADAVLFPSLAEGLGMPVLEASMYDTPVACSDIPVLSELSRDGLYLFDPTDVDDIADTLQKAVQREGWAQRSKSLEELKKKYTWERSANVLYDGLLKEYKAPNKRVTVSVDIDEHSTAVKELAETVCGELMSRTGGDTRIFIEMNRSENLRLGYFIDENEAPSQKTTHLSFHKPKTSLRGLLTRQHAVEVVMDGAIIPRLIAQPTFRDTALGLYGWRYEDKQGLAVTSDMIADIIYNRLNTI